jgi:hypothetical protein
LKNLIRLYASDIFATFALPKNLERKAYEQQKCRETLHGEQTGQRPFERGYYFGMSAQIFKSSLTKTCA